MSGSSVTRRAFRRASALFVAADAVRHPQLPYPGRRRRGLRDPPVAHGAIDLRRHDVTAVRVVDVRRLEKQGLPVDGSSGLQEPDELALFLALPLRLEVAGRTDLARRQARERFLLVVLVAGRAGEVV